MKCTKSQTAENENETTECIGLHSHSLVLLQDQQSNGSHIYLAYHNGECLISRKFHHSRRTYHIILTTILHTVSVGYKTKKTWKIPLKNSHRF